MIRAGIGLFYENSIWNNILFDPAARLQQGLFLGFAPVCSSGTPQALPFTSPTGITPAEICGNPIGSVTSDLVTLQQQYQAFVKAQGPTANGTYIGTTLLSGIDINTTSVLAPNYVTPRSVQMNIGVQREIRPGMVLTVDYLRNVATHNLLSIDTNHVGDSRFFNLANANAAIAATLGACGVASIDSAIASCPGLHPTGGEPPSSTFRPTDWTPATLCGGGPCPNAAFPGINPNVGANQLLFPIGRSVYNGLQSSLRQNVHTPLPGIKYLSLQVSYAFSVMFPKRGTATLSISPKTLLILKYIGPTGLDRTHQLSFGGTMDLPAGFRLT